MELWKMEGDMPKSTAHTSSLLMVCSISSELWALPHVSSGQG